MTDFPIDMAVFNKILEVFNQTRRYVLFLFPLAFFIRIALGFILLKSEGFTDILKDSLFLFLGLFFFADILRLSLQIPYFVSSELSMGDWRYVNLGESIFTRMIKRVVDWLGILSYWISFGLYIVIVSALGFFAGYILFFGTMFRAYGVLKVFFILLFTVSLWPLLWYSINFAVYTIAVSDNALANNVIIGWASLAKVFLPVWIISKSSRIPVAQSLKQLSHMGASLAYHGGGKAYSAYNNITNASQIQKEEVNIDDNSEENETAIITQEEAIRETETNLPGFDGDFSISTDKEQLNHDEIPLDTNNNQQIQAPDIKENQIEVHENSSNENSIQNTTEVEVQNNSTVQEKETHHATHEHSAHNVDTSQVQSNENKTVSHQEVFNEDIHRNSFIENSKENINQASTEESNIPKEYDLDREDKEL